MPIKKKAGISERIETIQVTALLKTAVYSSSEMNAEVLRRLTAI